VQKIDHNLLNKKKKPMKDQYREYIKNFYKSLRTRSTMQRRKKWSNRQLTEKFNWSVKGKRYTAS
jgi:hypothetical protein